MFLISTRDECIDAGGGILQTLHAVFIERMPSLFLKLKPTLAAVVDFGALTKHRIHKPYLWGQGAENFNTMRPPCTSNIRRTPRCRALGRSLGPGAPQPGRSAEQWLPGESHVALEKSEASSKRCSAVGKEQNVMGQSPWPAPATAPCESRSRTTSRGASGRDGCPAAPTI